MNHNWYKISVVFNCGQRSREVKLLKHHKDNISTTDAWTDLIFTLCRYHVDLKNPTVLFEVKDSRDHNVKTATQTIFNNGILD